LRKEDDDARAKTKAGDENMEVDAEPKGERLNYTSLSFIDIWLMLSILQNQRVQYLTIALAAGYLVKGVHEPYQRTKNRSGQNLGRVYFVSNI